MSNAFSAVKDTVSISELSRDTVEKVFKGIGKSGARAVMKGNAVECVLLSPEEYVRLMDELEDAKLYALALERMSRYDPSQTVSQEEVDARLGLTAEDLAGWEDVELE